jgi:hypothetical protein
MANLVTMSTNSPVTIEHYKKQTMNRKIKIKKPNETKPTSKKKRLSPAHAPENCQMFFFCAFFF